MAAGRHSAVSSEYMNHRLVKLAFGVDATYLLGLSRGQVRWQYCGETLKGKTKRRVDAETKLWGSGDQSVTRTLLNFCTQA